MIPFEPQGWRCPNCGSAHAPSVQTCPVQMKFSANGYGTQPQKCQCGLYPSQTCSRRPCLLRATSGDPKL